MKLSYEDAVKRYGPIVNNTWPDEAKWCIVYHTPQWFSNQVVNSATGFPCMKIYMNKDMMEAFDKALNLLYSRGLHKELKTFDGDFMIRDVRGMPGHPSAHSYGLAVDLNASENKLGCEPTFSKEFLGCWKEVGFSVGAYFHRKDPMHFSWAWE